MRVSPNRRPLKRVMFRSKIRDVHEIARMLGVSTETIYRRWRLGIPLDAPVTFGKEPMRLEFRGTLATLKEIAAVTGYSRSQVSKRHDGVRFFEKGEQIDPYQEPPAHCRMIFYNGINDSLSGWARRADMESATLAERLKRRWSMTDALTKPVQPYHQRITYKGKTLSIARWASRLGLPSQTIRERLRAGWPVERALDPLRQKAGPHSARRRMVLRIVEGFNRQSVPAQAIPAASTSPTHMGGP